MKIVKEFHSTEYAQKISLGYDNPYIIWGLGDDGNLYAKYSVSRYHSEKNWHRSDLIRFGLTIGEMKRIVNEFGHLIIFT